MGETDWGVHCHMQWPQPCSRPQGTHASARGSWTLAGKSGSVSCGVTVPWGHWPGKGQFPFQSQRRAMAKNVQTSPQLHSSHTLAKECSKFSKPGFSSMWIVNFQMFKQDLEKAEELEVKLPTSLDHRQENSRKTSTSALLIMPKPLMCRSQQTVENSSRVVNIRPPDLPPKKSICRSRNNRLIPN